MEKAGYLWADRGYALYDGEPSRRVFDKKNGDQVLFLINCCATFIEGFTSEKGKIMEEKIHSELPAGMKSEISVFNWLRQNGWGIL